MRAFELVRAEELNEFTDALRRLGWHEHDFGVEEEKHDPVTAEVEAETGRLTIVCTRTHSVGVYHLGRGSSWVTDFVDDLRAGKFGRPSRTQG
jgi:hypothetical protein